MRMGGRGLIGEPGRARQFDRIPRAGRCRRNPTSGGAGARIGWTAMEVTQSAKLANVCYDIRGPVMREAKRMEADGHRILKLNIGNPAPFGFDAPEEMLQDVILNLPAAHGYGDSKGLLSARRAVVQHYQDQGVTGVDI